MSSDLTLLVSYTSTSSQVNPHCSTEVFDIWLSWSSKPLRHEDRLSLAWCDQIKQHSTVERLVKSRFNWIITYRTDTWGWAWWRAQYSAMCKGSTATGYARVPQVLRPVSTLLDQGGASSEPKNWFLARKTGSRVTPSLARHLCS